MLQNKGINKISEFAPVFLKNKFWRQVQIMNNSLKTLILHIYYICTYGIF
jgi:hypothetical protein